MRIYRLQKGKIFHGDALEVLRTLPDKSIQCCVTSPPYWGLRDYGVAGQLGLERTPQEYVREFGRFARSVQLETYTLQVLRGRKGRELLLRHMGTIPLKARRFVLAALECVWTEGGVGPWPINRKRDFGKTLPPIGRRRTPPDADVATWAAAARQETDVYARALLLLLLTFGWRPEDQLAAVRRHHLQVVEGRRAIVADADECGFKTSSPIVAWVPPEIDEALRRLHEAYPGTPDDPILPWRSRRGPVDVDRSLDKTQISHLLRALERKWGLPHLTPMHLRHWVKTATRKLGVSDPAAAAWQGHHVPNDGSMRNWYDNPRTEALLDEQATAMPRGPLALIEPPDVRVVEGPQTDALAIVVAYLNDRIGLMDLMSRLETIKRKAGAESIAQP